MNHLGPRRAVTTVLIAAADLAYALTLQARTLRRVPTPARLAHVSRPGAAPVLLLPGVYESWRFLTPLATRIHQLGHAVHVLNTLRLNTRPIAETADVAADYLRHHQLQNVTLVAHSKGGLIGKALMLGPEGPRVARMLAIATPFTGSPWARYAPAGHLRAFSPLDPYTRGLAQSAAADARITSVFPRHDPLIPDGSTLPGATNIRLDADGHFLILRSPQLDAVLTRYLRA